MSNTMMTMTQFAVKLGVTRQRVHQLKNQRKISPPAFRVGHVWLVQDRAKVLDKGK